MAGAGSSKKGVSGWVWFFLVLAVWVAAAVIVENRQGAAGPAADAVSSPETARTPVPGDRGRLESADGQDIYVAIDQAALKELADAQVNKDEYGVMQVLAANRALPVPRGTMVMILEAGADGQKVEILEGELKGYAGWVPKGSVKSL